MCRLGKSVHESTDPAGGIGCGWNAAPARQDDLARGEASGDPRDGARDGHPRLRPAAAQPARVSPGVGADYAAGELQWRFRVGPDRQATAVSLTDVAGARG